MTKRHFEDFARRIKADRDNARTIAPRPNRTDGGIQDATRVYDETAYAAALISAVAAEHNPRFDRARFFRACGIMS